MATRAYGNIVNGYWRVYFDYTVDNSYSQEQARVTLGFGVYWVKAVKGNTEETYYNCAEDDPLYVHCNHIPRYASSKAILKNSGYKAGSSYPYFATQHFLVNKESSPKTITIGAYINHNSKTTLYKGTSRVTVDVTISAVQKYTIAFDKNTSATVYNMPDPVTKYHDEPLILPDNVPRVSEVVLQDENNGELFAYWYEESEPNRWYEPNAVYLKNNDAVLKALWTANKPPIINGFDLEITPSVDGNIIGGFSTVSIEFNGHVQDESRTLDKVWLVVTIDGVEYKSAPSEPPYSFPETLTLDLSAETTLYGDAVISLRAVDSEGAMTNKTIKNVLSVHPTWSQEVVVSCNEFPRLREDGSPILDKLEIKNYTTNEYDVYPSTGFDFIPDGEEYDVGTTWSFTLTFDEDHVDPDSADMTQPNVDVIVSYRGYKSEISAGGQAFFVTSRNKNYSNGIYNVMFVSGVDQEQYKDFSSRVWWCKYNDPLYFPDTNYVEVGSNDTAIQGLTKVGDYLAVIKQSKTTDTAIFLLYPTSFEEDTTFAVKQGVQGVGALSKYSFNILGDETLFLSPKGVVAVIPTDDEEHKVQNRSYFVDKKMLNEPNATNAFSFVHDGKYFISMCNGNVYVLDGNQRNSWGNDKTNLVYECYFLTNVPATSFAKFKDRLAFTDGDNVCIFNDGYADAYDADGHVNVPVKAEWSTKFDDDNALHYYKTMQKKGNLVSILPIENQKPYRVIVIDEETFNSNKGLYFVLEDNKYVNCENKTYDATETYYIENRTGTKVFVKKDDNDLVEIQRKFNLLSDAPSELYFNKKFKKYKRLQFIIRNETAEDFGIDEIVKNYTIGNYAKK